MNRKEEMEALIEDCERYAKIIEGIQVAPDNWKDGDPTRREPRETLLKCAAALRASAAPGPLDEWIEREFAGHGRAIRTMDEPAYPGEPYMSMADAKELTRRAVAAFASAAPDAWSDDKLAAWASNWHCNDCATNPVDPTIYFRDMRMLKAFRAALPSDSGKAAPDTLIEKIATEAERYASHYPQSSDGRNTFIMFADFVRALAPATEGGGRVLAEIAAERLGQISKGYDAAHDDEHTEGSIATAAAVYALHPFGWHFVISERVKGRSRSRLLSLRDFWPWEWDQFKPGSERQRLVKSAAMLVAEIERMDRLSPSPSVGTPAQPSARREGGA